MPWRASQDQLCKSLGRARQRTACELPSLLQERWLAERDLLARFARHHVTGELPPATLLDAIERANRFDRIFSVNLDFLAGAIAQRLVERNLSG